MAWECVESRDFFGQRKWGEEMLLYHLLKSCIALYLVIEVHSLIMEGLELKIHAFGVTL